MKDILLQTIKNNKSVLVFPLVAIATVLLYNVLPYQSNFVEQWYSNGIFALYRNVWDYSIGFIPIGLIYLLLIFIVFYLTRPFFKQKKSKWSTLLKRIVNLASIGIIIFYWLWGFNYKRSSFAQLSALPDAQPDSSFIHSEYARITDSLAMLRNQIDDPIHEVNAIKEHEIRTDLESGYEQMGLSSSGRVRVVKIIPKGSLLHISTAGVYLPFIGQGHIDAGLHPITHPFTMMHEMSHGYGWTGEDVCNFLALLSAVNSSNKMIRYSGYFGYWRYLRSTLYQMDREHFEHNYRNVPDLVGKDYEEILEYSNRYEDIMPKLRDLIYDSYLKSHGIQSGLINYSEMIQLSYKWQEKHGTLRLGL